MKKTIKTLAILLAMLPVFSFAQNAKAPVWPEMKNFHKIMSSTFHPSEEGNFKPLREKADSLYIIAQLWSESAIPSSFKSDETRNALQALVKQCHRVKESVNGKATDEQLKEQITEAHDIFHKIVGECKKSDE